jgi:beta-galactosidase
MRVGVCYYPEHWDKSLWAQDARRMQATGVKVVRVAESAWSRLEPEEDRFEFGWLDEAIDILHRHDLQVVIGTPTYAPPNWLAEKYPDILLKDARLHPRYPGVRMHRCVNSPSMQARARAIVEQMARHYAAHPAVIGWQVDNEFEMTLCNCDNCNRQFREWLKRKYGSLERVNREWGTVVWSGEYGDWSQVHSPLGGWRQLNPSYQLDYYRFQNDSIEAFQQLQVETLRRHCPHHLLTHNSWESWLPLDYPAWFEPLDVAAVDYYPNANPEQIAVTPYHGALTLDQTRGFKRRNFWVMEQWSGVASGCWGPMERTAPPGAIRAFAWQSISRGADAVVFFRWRSASGGSEQLGHGLLDHSNLPGRRFHEFARFCSEVNRLAERLEGTTVQNEAAILSSHEQQRAFQIQPHVDGGLSYLEPARAYHRALVKLGVGVDVIDWAEELDGYRLVIAPPLFLLGEVIAAKLERFVRQGGTLILTYRTGVKNLNNVCWMLPPPGPLARCAGVMVEEVDPIGDAAHQVKQASGKRYACRQWCDILQPTTAEPIAWYAEDYYAGKPAATVNALGKGKVYYLGTNFEEAFLLDLFAGVISDCGIFHVPDLPEGVQASVRRAAGKAYLFLLNLSLDRKMVRVRHAYTSLLNRTTTGDTLTLEPFAVEILEIHSSV